MSFGTPLLDHGWTHVNGLRMAAYRPSALVPADAPPLVIQHGLGAASDAQLPVARELAGSFRVYVPDLPGYGRSDNPTETLDVDGAADALAAWMDAEGLPRASFLANSAGCQFVTALAARHPRRVRSLVLQGPTFDPYHRSTLRQVVRFGLDSVHERPSLALVQLAGVWHAGPIRLLRSYARYFADRIERRLPDLECPVLVVRGSRDYVASRRWAERAADLAPRGALRLVPGAPHCMVYSAPLELARVVRPFLAADASEAA